jgi:wyosine [tRNA(Phe)-imidazoG37] synthetase (radical SAM superfamily)
LYCQLGRTPVKCIEREHYYSPAEISSAVREQLKDIRNRNESVDFITFVPDGEPTLDVNLGEAIRRARSTGERIAVITNGSLLWRKDVRNELRRADLVSVKVDSVRLATWRRINGPHRPLDLEKVLDGIREFSSLYNGVLITETMLLDTINDSPEELFSTASFAARLHPRKSYIAVPVRPPAAQRARPATPYGLATAYSLFTSNSINTELLISEEGNDFASTGSVARDLLSITSVHPMRRSAVEAFLRKNDGNWSMVESLMNSGDLKQVEYEGKRYFIRNFGKEPSGKT